ncbi:MAG: TlpA family protein disulfide reductase [Betaproteobacteria bacterium]|nr:TlpA family protein disulfide reductase [Betaproteobacteria bacterium]
MNRKLVGLLIVVVALGAGFAGWLAHERADTQALVPSNASAQAVAKLWALQLPDAEGKPQALAQWQGKTLVLNFWASWCPPCREEMPLLSQTQTKWQAQGVQIVGVGIDEASSIRKFSDAHKLPFPLLVAGLEQVSLTEQLGNSVQGLPFTVIIDPEGKLRHVKLGPFRGDQLDRLLESLTRR